MTVEDRGQVLALVAEAVAQGSRQHTACELVGVAERTRQRWQRPETAEDGRRGPHTAPPHTLSPSEREQIVTMAACAPRSPSTSCSPSWLRSPGGCVDVAGSRTPGASCWCWPP